LRWQVAPLQAWLQWLHAHHQLQLLLGSCGAASSSSEAAQASADAYDERRHGEAPEA
jgi:hypothetical protein